VSFFGKNRVKERADFFGEDFERWRINIIDGMLVHYFREPFYGVQIGAVGWLTLPLWLNPF
jgi:hypothetical protein